MLTAEHERLQAHRERRADWRQWGPYLSERAWGTVREDYSANSDVWNYFPHDHARSRAYRWNEDGLAGISDRNQYRCFALALWNGQDPILKERLFGLTGPQGNHGEDVKELYFYTDNTPTHSYMAMRYWYPQAAFPYADLAAENARRGYLDFEYELADTGIFNDNRYFDVLVEYAKVDENDLVVSVGVSNRGPVAASLHLLPTLWFRNTWSWGYSAGPMNDVPGKPNLYAADHPRGVPTVQADHPTVGRSYLYADAAEHLIFTENETNNERLFSTPNRSPYVKDAFHRYLVEGDVTAVNPHRAGTKAAAVYELTVPAGETVTVRLRLSPQDLDDPFADFDALFVQRRHEADEFYTVLHPADLCAEDRHIQRQAWAGMLWTKQLYYLDMPQWQDGDPILPAPSSRREGRNEDWRHMANFDIISMPDKWEYPWYATWDLAFHTIPLVMIDPDYAKRQLELFTREWYMHPNGALPAYEWKFGDVNPPVHAWAALHVYNLDAELNGKPDRAFLETVFHKLLLNFTWWVNRKDSDGRNIFQGGFLGLDNISLFDRSAALPDGMHIDQSDGTAWMGFYSLEMMKIALELARDNPVYQDMATKFFEHFLRIASAMNDFGGHGVTLWDEDDEFFYDVLHLPDDSVRPLRVRSLVGLLPLIAVETLEPEVMRTMPDFHRRTHWFLENRPQLAGTISSIDEPGVGERNLVALLTRDRLTSLLRVMLDEDEFLSPYGIRSLSKAHSTPYVMQINGQSFSIQYQPAESDSGLFGGNSNWRGPVWFPINYLLIEALYRYHHYYGDDFKVECPTGSGKWMTLDQVAGELSERLTNLFRANAQGRRPIYGGQHRFADDPHWRDHLLFYEYFHGDNGAGLGASHQTGWTGLVATLLQRGPGGKCR
ncbi:glucosidase [bacterium]|nr:glucosidase [bacterium]